MLVPESPLEELAAQEPAGYAGAGLQHSEPSRASTDLVGLLRTQVRRSPEASAVVFEDADLTYRELDERVDRLAAYLSARGVRAEIPVAIILERSLDMIVAVLGVQRAGGAYVPIDPHFPTERIAFMLSDSNARITLTQERLQDRLPPHDATIVLLDGDRSAIAAAPPAASSPAAAPGQLAYIIYTSGSTGRPKGVLIEHRNVLNFLHGTADAITVRPGDTLVAVAPLVFDIAGLDIQLALTSGARLVVASRETSVNPQALIALLERSDATHLQATPSTWRMLIEAGWPGRSGMTAMSTGEALPQTLAEQLLPRVGELWNLYGPTEATYATMQRIVRDYPITIGRAMPNVSTYILDAALQPAQSGAHGELYIGGAGVTRGYLNRPELNAERFLPDPFSEGAGARMYRSGDVARFLPDGTIEYSGRADFQIKLRGYRIEPGEIETLLEERPDIRSAVVLAKERASKEDALVAYVTVAPDAGFSVTAVRRELATRLPSYMVPDVIVPLDELPINANGKVDRGALGRLALPESDERRHEREAVVRPRTALEERLTAIWEEVLGVRPIGTTDDFFALGASSLSAARLFDRISRELGAKLPLSPLFEAPTIAKLAELIEQSGGGDHVGRSLVPMQTQATGTPIFCVHGGAGTVLHFLPLAKRLGPTRPVYALQMKGLYGDAKPDFTVEQMARHYVREVKTVQPRGPYL